MGWPEISINASCVLILDFNGDGKPDIFIGGRNIPGHYGMPASSVLLQNMGNGEFRDVTASIAPELIHLGMVTDAQWVDLNHDGTGELVIVGDWMPVTIFRMSKGMLKKSYTLPHSSGWWNCLTVADVNGDGYPDLIGGNFGLNSRIKPDSAHPAKLYVGDFAGNGRTECIPVYYKTDGKAYPYFMKGELEAEIPQLKKKLLRFSDYAGKSIDEVFTKEQLSNAMVLTVDQPKTCVFLNDGKGNFKLDELPVRAEFSPVFGIGAADLNDDGRMDLFMVGNLYGVKPQTGRFDASYGVTLLGLPGGGFEYMEPSASGLFVKGEGRDIATIRSSKGDEYILVGVNNENLLLFRKQKQHIH
jgi:hypothetical protein